MFIGTTLFLVDFHVSMDSGNWRAAKPSEEGNRLPLW